MNKTYNPHIMPSFNFYGSWMGYFRQLSAYDAQILLEWCFWYCFEQKEPNDENLNSASWRVCAAWDCIKPQLDQQFEKWKSFCNNRNYE